MIVVTPPQEFKDIEHVYCGSVYPGPQYLEGCKTALCLFSAMWHGRQDVYWLAKAGLTGTCVDLNGDRLAQMEAVYPDGWEFVTADVFDYVQDQERTWDVVTLDPWSTQFERCADMLPVWTELANRVVVLGHGNYRLDWPKPPAGWVLADSFKRSDFKGGVYWLVFAHA
jgi:hypothetical protein